MGAPAATARDTTPRPPPRPQVDYRKFVPPLALGLTVVALVVGAVFTDVDTGGRLDQARQMLARLYERDDVEAVLDRLAPGSSGAGPATSGQLRQLLGALLAEPFQVTSSGLVTVRDVTLAAIRTPRMDWCVLPDGRLLLHCRVAAVRPAVEVSGTALDAPFAEFGVFADRLELAVVLTSRRDRQIPLGRVRIEGPPGGAALRLSEAAYAAADRRVRTGIDQLTVRPGTGLVLVFEATDVERFDATLEGPFLVRWHGGSLRLTTVDTRWFIGPGVDGEAAP